MRSQVIVGCATGNKVAVLSVEDPCPSGQKMVTQTILMVEQADLVQNGYTIPLTSSEASEIWAIAFGSVLFCWLTSKGIGTIVNFIKN